MAETLAAAAEESLQSAALFTFFGFVLFSFTLFTFRGKGQLESPGVL